MHAIGKSEHQAGATCMRDGSRHSVAAAIHAPLPLGVCEHAARSEGRVISRECPSMRKRLSPRIRQRQQLEGFMRCQEADTCPGAVIAGLGRTSSVPQVGGMQETCLAAPGIDVYFRHQGKRTKAHRGRVSQGRRAAGSAAGGVQPGAPSAPRRSRRPSARRRRRAAVHYMYMREYLGQVHE